jgi:hypothetical protein
MLSKVTPVASQGSLSFAKLFCTACLLLLFTSCYSVRIANQRGVAEPNLTKDTTGYYTDKKFTVVNTVVKIEPSSEGFTLNAPCSSAGLYSVEYRVTLGGLLLSAITFGRHRKVRVIYVCAKEQNKN